jgi:hypothetical protein
VKLLIVDYGGRWLPHWYVLRPDASSVSCVPNWEFQGLFISLFLKLIVEVEIEKRLEKRKNGPGLGCASVDY